MHENLGLQQEIYRMQKLLEATAKRYHFNFGHPRVIEVSQQLDELILQFMNRRSR